MAKIVIDGRMINESGIGRYLRNLVFELQKLDKKNEYFILLLKKDYEEKELFMDLAKADDKNENFHKVLADFRWYGVSEQIKLPGLLNKIKPDLVHVPHFNVPVMYRGKFVVTIHDLIHQHYKMDRATLHDPITYRIKHLGYKKVFGRTVKDSLRILTPSEYVKNQLSREWNINQSKITVTPEAVEDKLITIASNLPQDQEKRILKKFSITSAYIFYVGNAHPHKNVEGLIKAFKKIATSSPAASPRNDDEKFQLVLAGNDNYFWQKIRGKYIMDSRFLGNDNVEGDIVFTGFIDDEELAALYKNASVFVMPSFEEGFGIPILEAMAMGCPVVSSNAGSLQEVGGNAAIYFDPHHMEDMGNKINMVLESEILRKKLIKKGKERVKKFSWKKMAEETLEVYNQCM